ncbi:aminotransferase class I/II-fold pyridoxal phosphate-dependent enzyme, partial [candidate division KSB1 bacterium]
ENSIIVPSTRVSQIKYSVMDTIARAHEAEKNGRDIIYLHIGDPLLFDFDTPKHILDKTCEAIQNRKTGYTETSGIDEAIEAIESTADKKGIKNIRDIFITTGVSEAIDIALAALVNEGENVLTPCPSYPLYISALYKQGAQPNPYYLDESNNWQPDLDDIRSKINDKTRGIVIIYPNNPTGSLYSRETLQGVIDLALEHNLVIFSDEIYDKLLFDNVEHLSTAALTQDATVVTLNGFSKAYLAPGFRLGWMVISGREGNVRDYCEAMAKFTRARLCANHPEQYAIKPALTGDQSHIQDAIKKLERRRDITYEMLNAIDGISCVSPDGAFYAFPKIEYDIDDVDFVHRLIDETGVIPMHGSGFSQKEGTRHFRVVFLSQEDRLKEAYERIAEFSRQFQ